MATYPTDPNLSTVTSTTACDPAFFNTIVDNINAMGVDLARISDNTGNVDLAIDKGIAWATTLEIYMSGGNLVMDDDVNITGTLTVTGAITGDLSVNSDLDIPGTLTVDTINDSGAGVITFLDDIDLENGAAAIELTVGDSGASSYIKLHSELGAAFIEMDDTSGVGTAGTNKMRMHYNTNGDVVFRCDQSNVNRDVTLPFAPSAYTVTNDLTDRAYDANTVAVAELADVVGTIIADLQGLGLLG